jgi:RimJ/RimL family protein N-acetyltransferase
MMAETEPGLSARIWAATEVGNLAVQKALERAGFTREGVLCCIG